MPGRIQWLIPNAISPPRDGTDRKGQACTVFDFIVHTVTVRLRWEEDFQGEAASQADVVCERGDSTCESVLAEWDSEAARV